MTTRTKFVNRFLGCDVGKVNDSTTLMLVDQVVGYQEVDGTETYLDFDNYQYEVTHMERLKLGMSYPKQVEVIASRKRAIDEVVGCTLVVDCTGVGTPVLDMMRKEGLDPVGIWITGGENVNKDPEDDKKFKVPKRDLVTAVQVIQQQRRLYVANLPEKARLVKELQDFKIKISSSGQDTFGAWREGQHDDMVLGLAVALWLAAYKPQGKYISSCLDIWGISRETGRVYDPGNIPYEERTSNYRRYTFN